jgi:hypothetical protein
MPPVELPKVPVPFTAPATQPVAPVAVPEKAVAVEGAVVLTGSAESWRKTWRLRYVPVDVEDENGGRVTLVGDPALERLREGQGIRARGFLLPATDRATPPTFQVQSLELLD